jgi:hypothetical protein
MAVEAEAKAKEKAKEKALRRRLDFLILPCWMLTRGQETFGQACPVSRVWQRRSLVRSLAMARV